jgi:hypothetical protein
MLKTIASKQTTRNLKKHYTNITKREFIIFYTIYHQYHHIEYLISHWKFIQNLRKYPYKFDSLTKVKKAQKLAEKYLFNK